MCPLPTLHDCAPDSIDFRQAVLEGLTDQPKRLPCKFFYDQKGSELFDRICDVDEYYPTRTETDIMCRHRKEMAELLGTGCALLEYGSGSSKKTRILLDSLQQPAAYVPIDISREHLLGSAHMLALEYPQLTILPVCADYTRPFSLPQHPALDGAVHKVVYFPGSTIGNFDPDAAQLFLSEIAQVCGTGGALLVGVDLAKDAGILHRAYNDEAGVTAEFNLNLLRRMNSELGSDFSLEQWRHHAFYNVAAMRVEMHLVSQTRQSARIGDIEIGFDHGESICTEYSHKYSLAGFAELAAAAGFGVRKVWTDERTWFSVQYLQLL